MSFAIYPDSRNGIDFLILKNESNNEFIEIIPDLGATVNKLCLQINGKVRNILFCDDDNEILDNPLFRGRILFPFNDAIPAGIYQLNNKTYKLDVNIKRDESTFHDIEADNLAIHGFIYNKKPETVLKECDREQCSVSFQFAIGKEQVTGYPFDIILTIKYILLEHELKLKFEAQNSGEVAAPLSFGWHPYFTFDNSIKNVVLKTASEKYVETDETHISTRRILDCKDSKFDFRNGKNISSLNIDNALTVPSDGYTYLFKDGQKITLHQDTKTFKYVQLYVPDDNKSIAVEPVTAATNSFNFHELGLRVLEPGEKIDTFASVRVG